MLGNNETNNYLVSLLEILQLTPYEGPNRNQSENWPLQIEKCFGL